MTMQPSPVLVCRFPLPGATAPLQRGACALSAPNAGGLPCSAKDH